MNQICKQVFHNKLASKQFPISWKIDAQTQTLRVKFNGSNRERLIVKAQSTDLQSILGMTTIIDCSSKSSVKERSGGGANGQSSSTYQIKSAGCYPTDLNAGCHTMLIYCDLVQNEILGDCQTALLKGHSIANPSSLSIISR